VGTPRLIVNWPKVSSPNRPGHQGRPSGGRPGRWRRERRRPSPVQPVIRPADSMALRRIDHPRRVQSCALPRHEPV